MIKLEKTDIFGWNSALRGMRNAFNSWDKSDTVGELHSGGIKHIIGPNDMKLCKALANSSGDDRKFLRMIHVQVDITAPLYWWKEFDTYKVGTVANSCSTMHKIADKEFTLDDFSYDTLDSFGNDLGSPYGVHYLSEPLESECLVKECAGFNIKVLNDLRNKFLETKDKKYWYAMIQLLPSSYNQKRTVDLNYEVLKRMYHARKNHKLNEWRDFCHWVESLDYVQELIVGESHE